MRNRLEGHRWPTVGILSLLSAAAGFACWFLPFSPALFLFGVIGLQVLSLVLALGAGLRESPWWFAATLVPVFLFFLIVPQYEKNAEVSFKRTDDGRVVFRASGTFTVPSFTVAAYSEDVQAPGDPRFLMWRIEAIDQKGGGVEAWRIGEIKYGVVPPGYIQTFPTNNTAPSPLQSGKIYDVGLGGAFNRYFEIVNSKPRWVSNPPHEPCFTRRDERWVKVECH